MRDSNRHCAALYDNSLTTRPWMQLRNNRNNEWQKITKRMLFWSSAMVTWLQMKKRRARLTLETVNNVDSSNCCSGGSNQTDQKLP